MIRRLMLLSVLSLALVACKEDQPAPTSVPPTPQTPADYLAGAREGLQNAYTLFDTVVQWQSTARKSPGKIDSIRAPLTREAKKCAGGLAGSLPEIAPSGYEDFNKRALDLVGRIQKACSDAADAIEDNDDEGFRSLVLAPLGVELQSLRDELED